MSTFSCSRSSLPAPFSPEIFNLHFVLAKRSRNEIADDRLGWEGVRRLSSTANSTYNVSARQEWHRAIEEGIKPRLAVEMSPIRYDFQGRFQVIGYTLRTRQWDVGIISTCPAMADMPLPLSNAGPVERVGKERVIDRIIVGKAKRADEARCQKEASDRFHGPLNQPRANAAPKLCPTRMVGTKGNGLTARS